MRKIILVLILTCICTSVNAQIQVKRIGKVHYTIIPSNEFVTKRNDSIANALNDYIQENSMGNFPEVLLYITDQSFVTNLTDFEQILVYYQKYLGEFFEKYDNRYLYEGEHIGISLSLSKNHYIKAMLAIEYAVKNLKKLKKEEERLAHKKRKDKLTDKNLERFNLKI